MRDLPAAPQPILSPSPFVPWEEEALARLGRALQGLRDGALAGFIGALHLSGSPLTPDAIASAPLLQLLLGASCTGIAAHAVWRALGERVPTAPLLAALWFAALAQGIGLAAPEAIPSLSAGLHLPPLRWGLGAMSLALLLHGIHRMRPPELQISAARALPPGHPEGLAGAAWLHQLLGGTLQTGLAGALLWMSAQVPPPTLPTLAPLASLALGLRAACSLGLAAYRPAFIEARGPRPVLGAARITQAKGPAPLVPEARGPALNGPLSPPTGG